MKRLTTRKGTSRPSRNPRVNRAQGKITSPPATPGMIEQRARELAMIAGRTPRQVTASDRREAKRQLLGAVHPSAPERDERPWPGPPWETPVTSTGRRRRTLRPRDDQNTKELVEEGVDEAEHSRAVTARKLHK